MSLLRTLSLPQTSSAQGTCWVAEPRELLSHILSVTEFYEEKVGKAGAVSAKDALQVVSREIDSDGLFGVKNTPEIEEPP